MRKKKKKKKKKKKGTNKGTKMKIKKLKKTKNMKKKKKKKKKRLLGVLFPTFRQQRCWRTGGNQSIFCDPNRPHHLKDARG